MNKDVTIKDVAQMAGVSISTVSRVLNGLDRVSDETRHKVNEVARNLRYVPNSIAVSMITGSTKMIVVVVPDIINEYYTSVIQGAEEVAKSEGYYTLIFATGDEIDKEIELFNGSFVRIIDGAIIIPASPDPKYYTGFSKPLVMVDRYIPESGLEGVVIDNFDGTYRLTKHLVDNNHKDIAIIMGPTDLNIGKERYAGFVQALSDADIPIQDRYIKRGSWYVENGFNSTMQLLSMKNPPTAIIASNNLICIGCIKAIHSLGLEIGKDISVVGFDDNLLAEFVNGGVTVISRPTVEMGRMAAQKLIKSINGEKMDCTYRKMVLGVELLIRNSVKKL